LIDLLKLAGALLVFALLAKLAVVLVGFNRKRVHIIRAASGATDDQLEEIYKQVEASDSQVSKGWVLARTNAVVEDESCIVRVPDLPDFPWSGKSIRIEADKSVQFRLNEEKAPHTQLLGRIYTPVAVPRIQLKSGKARNRFDPKQYLKSNAALRDKLATVCPEYPTELLSYLLCAGHQSFEFEPIDQARIGTSAAWVQDPEFQSCGQCKKRLRLILQLPGTLVHKKAFHAGTFYLFGCASHPDQTATIVQYT
jgi:hypothetical protein